MAEFTSTNASKFHDIERKIYNAVMKQYCKVWPMPLFVPSYSQDVIQAAKLAGEMVKVFSTIQQAFVNEQIGRDHVTQWLMGLELSPIEMSEIIEEMDENRTLTFNILTQRLETHNNRPTGE